MKHNIKRIFGGKVFKRILCVALAAVMLSAVVFAVPQLDNTVLAASAVHWGNLYDGKVADLTVLTSQGRTLQASGISSGEMLEKWIEENLNANEYIVEIMDKSGSASYTHADWGDYILGGINRVDKAHLPTVLPKGINGVSVAEKVKGYASRNVSVVGKSDVSASITVNGAKEQGSGLDFSPDRPIMKATISKKETEI